MRKLSKKARRQDKLIGFVPTMGAFHEGHLKLIRKCRQQVGTAVVSIYVNPTQFGEGEDYEKYPRNLTEDAEIAIEEGVDYLFAPSDDEMYESNHLTYIEVEDLSDKLCGESRPDHFKGVCTIVAKLFNIVRPDLAYFGRKDAQQAVIVKKMIKDLNFDIKIVVESIVREEDGLATSSRNKYLDPEQRQSAISLYESLKAAAEMVENGERRTEIIKDRMREIIQGVEHTKIDYIEITDPETLETIDQIQDEALALLAVYVGETRLIDNILLKVE